MTVTSYAEVLKAAQQLPLEDQVEMAEVLLRNLRFALRSKPTESRGELAPLSNMNLQELRALAEAIMAPDRQQQLAALLDKNRNGELSPEEQDSLDELLAEVDQVALLKARARYTMNLYGIAMNGRHPDVN
jgi:pyruvate-formate lyase-activating enzyme